MWQLASSTRDFQGMTTKRALLTLTPTATDCFPDMDPELGKPGQLAKANSQYINTPVINSNEGVDATEVSRGG
jgi:hypothetical protein